MSGGRSGDGYDEGARQDDLRAMHKVRLVLAHRRDRAMKEAMAAETAAKSAKSWDDTLCRAITELDRVMAALEKEGSATDHGR